MIEPPPPQTTQAEGKMEVEPLEQRTPRRRTGGKPVDTPLPKGDGEDIPMEAESEELASQN